MSVACDTPDTQSTEAPASFAALDRKAKYTIDWTPTIAIGLVHIGALAAFWPAMFTWKALGTTFVMHWICGGFGLTLGYHRLLTHRSFKTPKWVEYLLTWVGSLSLQGGPIKWVAVHRLHHQHSDGEGDPHTPLDGFVWSHALWLFRFDPNFDPYEKYSQYALDLARDRVHVAIQKYVLLSQLVVAVALYFWGGWPCVVWGVFVRLVYVYHVTWLVNSASHVWGYRSHETTDRSRNLWWVALLTWGEGWHNNHHAYPRSARHGMRPWEIDFTWWHIRLMAFFGLASDIRVPGKGASRESQ